MISNHRVALRVQDGRGVTLYGLHVHDCCVSENSPIKYTEDLVVTHVDKILSFNCHLSEAVLWTTDWINVVDNRLLIVKILNRWRIHVKLHCDGKRNKSWMIHGRWIAFNLRLWEELSRNNSLIKLASDILSVPEIWTYRNDLGTASYWSLSRVGIKKEGWTVIVEDVVIICVLLIVQSDLNYRLSEYCGRGRYAIGFCRIYHQSWNFSEVLKHAESVIGIIDFQILEGVKVSTSKEYVSTSGIWTSVRDEICDSWEGVVPEKQCVPWVLLVVQRYSERYWFFDDIWKWRHTDHVVWTDESGEHWLWTKGASCVFVEVEEVFTPYLHHGFSILRSVPGVYSKHSGWWIISEGDGVWDILEVTSETYRERHDFSFVWGWTVITLETGFILQRN